MSGSPQPCQENLYFESVGGNSTALQLGELSLFIDLKRTLVRKKVHSVPDPAFVGCLVRGTWRDPAPADTAFGNPFRGHKSLSGQMGESGFSSGRNLTV